jgi:hypothetical protein
LKAENSDFDESEYIPLPVPTLDDVRNHYELARQQRLRENEQNGRHIQRRQQLQNHPSRFLKTGTENLVGMSGVMKKGDGKGMMMGMKKDGGGDMSAGRCDVGELTSNNVFNAHFAWQSNGFINVTNGESGVAPMNPARDTLEYRTFGYGYLNERYGLSLDPTDPNPFNTILGDDGVTPVAVLIAGENQNIPQMIMAGTSASLSTANLKQQRTSTYIAFFCLQMFKESHYWLEEFLF